VAVPPVVAVEPVEPEPVVPLVEPPVPVVVPVVAVVPPVVVPPDVSVAGVDVAVTGVPASANAGPASASAVTTAQNGNSSAAAFRDRAPLTPALAPNDTPPNPLPTLSYQSARPDTTSASALVRRLEPKGFSVGPSAKET
jgi:hypothetical protein